MNLRATCTFDNFLYRFPDGFAAWCVGIALFCFGASVGIFAWDRSDLNTHASERGTYMRLLNSAPSGASGSTATREGRAAYLLELKKEGLIEERPLHGSDVHQIERMAHTGVPVKFGTKPLKFSHYWDLILPWILIGLWLIMWNVSLIVYTAESSDRNEYIADLPWRRVWPFFYAAVTAFPVGWICWLVSWRSTRKLRALRQREREEREREERREERERQERRERRQRERQEAIDRGEVDPDPEPDAETERPARPEYHFPSDPDEARKRYRDMRKAGRRKALSRAIERLEETIRSIREDIRTYGQRIKDGQRAIGNAEAQLAIKKQQLDVPDETVSRSALEAEFDRIMQMPGVSDVGVVGDAVAVLVKARYEYRGVTYDFGDWELSFSADSSELRSRLLRHSGRQLYPNGEGFCFGVRRDIIDEHVRRGQFAEAINVAVDCLHSVNRGDESAIPEFYKEVAEVNA